MSILLLLLLDGGGCTDGTHCSHTYSIAGFDGTHCSYTYSIAGFDNWEKKELMRYEHLAPATAAAVAAAAVATAAGGGGGGCTDGTHRSYTYSIADFDSWED